MWAMYTKATETRHGAVGGAVLCKLIQYYWVTADLGVTSDTPLYASNSSLIRGPFLRPVFDFIQYAKNLIPRLVHIIIGMGLGVISTLRMYVCISWLMRYVWV